jgi:flagellin
MSNLVVQTNVLALNSHRNLKVIGNKTSQASARLSSGYRINSAADDAAGLAISEKMRAQIRGLDMASKNTQDGISLVQTAEGGLQEVDNMIQRIRELTDQAANDTNDYASLDRQKIQDEIDQLIEGIDDMAGQVEFNNKRLLDGSLTGNSTRGELLAEVNLKLGKALGTAQGSYTGTTEQVISNKIFADVTAGDIGKSYFSLNESSASLRSANIEVQTGSAPGSLQSFALQSVSAKVDSADINSASGYDQKVGMIDSYIESLKSAKSKAYDQDAVGVSTIDGLLEAAGETKELLAAARALYVQAQGYEESRQGLAELKGNDLWFQTGANSTQGISVGIGSVKSNILGIGDGYGNSKINVNTADGEAISNFINRVNDALNYVTSQRAKLGAVQNRMEYTKSSLDISSENLSSSESRIRDADMAKEMMKLTAANVLNQAGVSMLSQANQAPQSVLQLLQ